MILNKIFKKNKNNFIIPRRRNVVQVISNPEVLLNNHLNKNLQQFLRPLNLLQNLCLLPKYKILDNFITSNDWKCKFKSVCIGLIFIFLTIYSCIKTDVVHYYSTINGNLRFIDWMEFLLVFLNFLFIEIQTLFYSNENVEVILLVNDVYALINHEGLTLKKLIRFNWIFSMILFVIAKLLFIIFHTYYKFFDIYDIFSDTIVTISHINIIYTVGIIKLLKKFLGELTENLKSMLNNLSTDDDSYCEISSAYEKILKAYTMYTNVFQPLVLK